MQDIDKNKGLFSHINQSQLTKINQGLEDNFDCQDKEHKYKENKDEKVKENKTKGKRIERNSQNASSLVFTKDDDPKVKIKHILMGALSRREHSKFELLQKVKLKKLYKEEDINLVLNELEEKQYQSDERFVTSFVKLKVHSGYGPQRIKTLCAEKGVSSSLIFEALEVFEESWVELATTVWQKKYGGSDLCSFPDSFSYLDQSKQKKFLLYRGFDFCHINSVFEHLKNLSHTVKSKAFLI